MIYQAVMKSSHGPSVFHEKNIFWSKLDKNNNCIVGCTNIDRPWHDLYIRTLLVYVERGPEAARHIRGGKKATLCPTLWASLPKIVH